MNKINNTEKINWFKSIGYLPKFNHYRYLKPGVSHEGFRLIRMGDYYKRFTKEERRRGLIEPRGGITEMLVYDKHGDLIDVYRAKCNGRYDNYNKRLGVHICIERFLKDIK